MSLSSKCALAAVAGVLVVSPLFAQIPNPYGAAIGIESARKVAAAAVAESRKNNWNMAIAIVDPAGELVYFEKLDGTQQASVNIAIDKARSSARFKRPTKALADVLATGGAGLRMLALDGAMPVEGGVPIVIDGKLVGAIGVSGGTSQQDGQVAMGAAAAVK
jgi:glc operon protein GlcG